MADIKWSPAAIASLMTTELNSLANNNGAIASSGYDNATNKVLYGVFELNVTFGSAPTAGNTVDLYLIPAADGTNYDDGAGGASPVSPPTHYAGSFVLRAVTTAQKIALGVGLAGPVWLPPVPFKALLVNKSGVAFPASGSTLKMVPLNQQVA